MVDASDVLVFVLDARDPMGTRCLQLERCSAVREREWSGWSLELDMPQELWYLSEYFSRCSKDLLIFNANYS